MGKLREYALACTLAAKDWAYETLLSLCMVFSLASILVPLLVLGGIQYGVISSLTENLSKDPAILTVTPVGSGAYTKEWILAVQEKQEVSFAIPRTRDIAATMQLIFTKANGQSARARVSLEPTAEGDPVVETPITTSNGLVLSYTAAQNIGAAVGETVTGQLGRKTPQGNLESVEIPMLVEGILPIEKESKEVAYVPLTFLEDAENYRDYIAVPSRGFSGDEKQASTFASFRLYAKDLESVGPLRDFFEAQNIPVYTKAAEIATVQSLDRSLSLIFALVGLTVSIGAFASMASNVLAAVRRKDKHLGMLRLLGFSTAALRLFPVTQAVLTGFMATLLAGLAYLALAAGINALFAGTLAGGVVCSLPFIYYLAIVVGVLLLSVLSSLQGAAWAAKIAPSDVLREI